MENSKKIVVLDGYTLCAGELNFDALRAFGDVTVYDRAAQADVARLIGDAQIVLTNKAQITADVMAACPQMEYVGVTATGYNIVDVAEAKRRGIVVTNAPAYSTQAVAQHTFALLLESLNRVGAYSGQVRGGAWQASADFCFFSEPMEEIAGKTIGLIGFGHIGQSVAKIALAFGMNVLVCVPHPKAGWDDVRFVTLDELMKESDVVSLHCPLTEENRRMIDEKAIARMKPGVRIINTARGGLVDESAMAAALESGRVACDMADVLSEEPPVHGSPLLEARHAILTPHVAWAPLQTRRRLMKIVVGNVEGRPDQRGEPMIRGVVFDLDGTLLDTEKLYRRFWVEAARRMGYPMEDRHALMIRSMAADMAEPLLKREVCPAFDYHAVRALRRQIMEDYIDENGVEPKPGLLPMIRDLQRMRMRVALATATPEVRARKYLRMVGVEDAFDAVACAEMVAHGKPAPDVYLLAAQKLNLPPEELLGVEDSPSGVRSAHSAGMTVAMIPDQDEPSAEIAALCALVAPTLEGIIPFIEKLNANKFD